MQEQQEQQEQQSSKAGERAEPRSDLFDRDRVREALAAYAASVREDTAQPAEVLVELTEEQRLVHFD